MKTLLTLLLLTSINIAYAAQTCYHNIINNTPDSRYTNNNNGTITDKTSKLIWKQCSEGQIWVDGSPDSCTGTASTMNWQQALTLAASSTFAGNPNWQLPNIKQLRNIVSNHCYNPSINQTHFPNTKTNSFWSSTPSALNPSNALNVIFNNGFVSASGRNSNNYVRLVRPMP